MNKLLLSLIGLVCLGCGHRRPAEGGGGEPSSSAHVDSGGGEPSSSGPRISGIALGSYHSCVWLTDGSARCWGSNNFGQIGVTTTAAQILSDREPHPVRIPLGGVQQLTAGRLHTCALLTDGRVRCWGAAAEGQLGPVACSATRCQSIAPVLVPGLEQISEIAAGADHTCARRADGQVLCWGDNDHGESSGAGFSARSPRLVAGMSSAIAIAAGGNASCALLFDHSVRCWGRGSGPSAQVPRGLPPGPVAEIAVGGWQSCARFADHRVFCWAHENPSKAPVDAPDLTVPREVAGLGDAQQLALGDGHNCALLAFDRGMRCWGDNTHGQLGADMRDAARERPTDVSKLDERAVRIALGGQHSCALDQIGTLRCWGFNWYGQVGDGHAYGDSTPTLPTEVRW